MRSNPYAGTDKEGTELYKGDNFIRQSGSALEFNDQNRFAGLSVKNNGNLLSGTVHLQANPTLTEKAFKQHKKVKDTIKNTFTKKIIDIYGGNEHLNNPFNDIIFNENSVYVEYDQNGQIIKNNEVYIPKSKYNEDVLNNNHSQIWGSYYDIKNDKWGYACCNQTIYNTFCTKINVKKASNNTTTSNDTNNSNNNNVVTYHGVTMKPKELKNDDKLINPSGYVSTKGILANNILRKKMIENQNKKKKSKKRKLTNNNEPNNAKRVRFE